MEYQPEFLADFASFAIELNETLMGCDIDPIIY
jgi:hypothetical protein